MTEPTITLNLPGKRVKLTLEQLQVARQLLATPVEKPAKADVPAQPDWGKVA